MNRKFYFVIGVLAVVGIGAGIGSSSTLRVTIGNGLNYASGVLSMGAASGSEAGAVTTGAQTFAGAKTFSTSIESPSVTASAASGSDAFIAAQGAHLKLGTATLKFNGTALAASVGVSATSFTSTAASGAVAIAVPDGAKICLNGATAACARKLGSYWSIDYGVNTPIVLSTNTNSLQLWGYVNNGASAIAVKSMNVNALSDPGARIHAFYYDLSNKVSDIDTKGTYSMDGTDSSAVPGAATINQPLMIVAVETSASSVVITDSLVTATTPVFCHAQQVDATCTSVVSTVPASGSFTVNMNGACTAATKVACLVHGMF